MREIDNVELASKEAHCIAPPRYALNMGCAAGMLVMRCLKGMQLEESDVDGQTRDLLGLNVCQENDEEVWSGTNRTRGYATLVVA